jgi:hypothetical protein
MSVMNQTSLFQHISVVFKDYSTIITALISLLATGAGTITAIRAKKEAARAESLKLDDLEKDMAITVSRGYSISRISCPPRA